MHASASDRVASAGLSADSSPTSAAASGDTGDGIGNATLCLVADARSIHARLWAMHLSRAGTTGTVLSSRRLTRQDRSAWAADCPGFTVLEPADPWNVGRKAILSGAQAAGVGPAVGSALTRSSDARNELERRLDFWAAGRLARRIERFLAGHRPGLVHAFRIPYEGIAASMARTDLPLVVSTWGSDLKAQAQGKVVQAARRTLVRCDAFMADNSADLALAGEWGLPPSTPHLVVAGNMGIDGDAVQTVLSRTPRPVRGGPIVVYPRGVSPFVDHATFLGAVPRILHQRPDVRVVCVGLRRDPSAVRAAADLGPSVVLAEFMSQTDLWELFAKAAVVVSPGTSDGMSLAVLEATALGAVPVVYGLPSLNDLLHPPVYSRVVPRYQTDAMADAVVSALTVPDEVRQRNVDTVVERFAVANSRRRVLEFYRGVLSRRGPASQNGR